MLSLMGMTLGSEQRLMLAALFISAPALDAGWVGPRPRHFLKLPRIFRMQQGWVHHSKSPPAFFHL